MAGEAGNCLVFPNQFEFCLIVIEFTCRLEFFEVMAGKAIL
jgi:hypothetical protein